MAAQHQGDLLQDFVRPTVEYAATVWDPASARNIQAIEHVQRWAARFVTSRYPKDDSPTAMVAELGWLSLAHRQASARVLPSGHLDVNLMVINSQDFIDVNLMSMVRQDFIKIL